MSDERVNGSPEPPAPVPAHTGMTPTPGGPAPASTSAGAIVMAAGIAVLVLLLLAGLLLPMFWARRGHSQTARRISCLNNTKQIGLAMFMYAVDHNDKYPPLVDAMGNDVAATAASTEPARSAFAHLFKELYVETPKMFICPSSGDTVDMSFPSDLKSADIADLILAGDNCCSYGWDPTKSRTARATCAILADKPPLDVDPAEEGTDFNNSPNHDGEGQNVFYNDGHAKWITTRGPTSATIPTSTSAHPDSRSRPPMRRLSGRRSATGVCTRLLALDFIPKAHRPRQPGERRPVLPG